LWDRFRDGESLRDIGRALNRTPAAITSRSANDRYRPKIGTDKNVAIPRRCLKQRVPTAEDTPTAAAADSLVRPS
jgi:hypothetical protein